MNSFPSAQVDGLHPRLPGRLPGRFLATVAAALFLPLLLLFPARLAAGPCVPPPDGAVAWWGFDEAAGDTAVDRAGGHGGVLENQPLRINGLVHGGLHFTGHNWVTVPDSADWTLGSADFTIELWASFDTADSGSVGEPGHIFIGCDEGPSTRNKWFFAWGGGVLNFHVNGPGVGAQFFPLVPFSPVVGAWYHLAIVRSGTTFTIYINGVAAGSSENAVVIPDPNAPLTLGQAEQIGFVHGSLDEVSLYHRALSSSDIAAIHGAGAAGKCTPLALRPNHGGVDHTVTTRVETPGPAAVTRVSLRRTGHPEVVGPIVGTDSDGTAVTARFDLTGVALGLWDVTLLLADGSQPVLRDGFRVEPVVAPLYLCHFVALPVIRRGVAQVQWIAVENHGNVDGGDVHFFLGVPAGVGFRTGDSGEFTAAVRDTVIHYVVGRNGALDTRLIPLALRVDGDPGCFLLACATSPTPEGLHLPVDPGGDLDLVETVMAGDVPEFDQWFATESLRFQKCPVQSYDPNEKAGPSGFGPNRLIASGEPLGYSVRFENQASATAAAREVLVQDRLDPAVFDLDSFELGPVDFGSHRIVPPSHAQTLAAGVDLGGGQNFTVRITAGLDHETGLATWRFATVDTRTGLPPDDPAAGFLPPNQSPPQGEGGVLYSIRTLASVADGVLVTNAAQIVFDTNPPIPTGTRTNTLYNHPPDAHVAPLAPVQPMATFPVAWSPTGDPSAIRTYNVYVATNGGDPALWLENTADTTAPFTGTDQSAYAFYVTAADFLGSIQPLPSAPDARTTVVTTLRFQRVESTGSGVRLTWLGLSGTTYRIEGTTRLGVDPWGPVVDVPSPGATTTTLLPRDADAQFYRLRAL